MARTPVFLSLLLLASPLAAADPARVVVEFRGVPRVFARDAATATAQRDAFARFRADLAQLDASYAKSGGGFVPAVTHEYSMTFFGAAATVRRDAIARLRTLPYVAAVYDDPKVQASAIDARPATLPRRTGADAIDLPTRGKGITIAILDTGIDYTHPALRPGYVGGYDFVNRDEDPMDDSGHGTFVAGLAAGRTDEVTGVASEATIVAYKVLAADGAGYGSDTIAALERAADPNGDGSPADHLDVVNMSFGGQLGTADHPVSRAVDNTVAAGVVVVVAAGNSGSTVGTIGTPGNARRAITVAAQEGSAGIAFFSSRGPTAGLLTFKPDLAAPGVNLVSAAVGGGTTMASGTSVAAPQVAGAAALLLALHRDWSPDRVKSALVTTAKPMNVDAFGRGAGAMDVVAAASSADLVVSESGLSFGGNGLLEGTRTESRRFTITNRGAKTHSLQFASADAPAGCTITIAPAAIELAAGQSAEITVQLVADNSALRPPSLVVMGGDVAVTGTSTLRIPWALVRGSRATVRYDGELASAVAFGDRFRRGLPIDESSAEFWLPSNLSEDYVVFGGNENETRVLTVEKRIAGDEVITFKPSDATLKLTFDGRDQNGTRLADLPRVEGRSERFARLRIVAASGVAGSNDSAVREALFSPFPSRLRIEASEVYVDVDGGRGYVVQPKPFAGFTANATVTNDPYVHARLRFPPMRGLTACYTQTEMQSGVANPEACVARDDAEDVRFDLYTTPEVNPDRYVAMMFFGPDFATPPFRAANGTIVTGAGPATPAAVHRIAHASETWVGVGPWFPNRFPGATEVPTNGLPPRGFTGPLGETRAGATASAFFTLRDAGGTIVASGSLDNPAFGLPGALTGDRLQVVANGFTVAGHHARGQLDVQFGANPASLIAPSLDSLQLIGPNGNPTETLQRGDGATLRFAIADYVVQGLDTMLVIAPKSDATHVSFRVSGTSAWRALPVTLTGSELGPRAKSLPSGEMYRADLRDATAVNDVAIDLRFEFEDVVGNHVTWVQEPAFVVGAPPKQPRRRSR